ncbi:flagellar basal body-associated FliL family protein [Collimonas arenae]|uniref:Flagellar protein FliL n=1 Tax=Collimonas arenae TaxID=279058 RepID=A0A127QFZ9_9BURK|nr:flagellar basal body-associated protein FliL [Collimonas arenae]AMO98848.1 flagellar basal body-associated FliL family protein [Collimonas arenae]AMP08745.1 flagellar basal body-associated FliL family protein [Collimonas arenae]
MATITNDAAAPPKKNKLGLILIVLTAALAAAGAAYYFTSMRTAKAAAAPVSVPETPIFVALDPFTVNLQAEDRDRFLHIGVTLKVADAKTQAQIVQYLPETRSRILGLLSNRDPNSLVTADDKNKLAAEILKVVNKPLAISQPPQHVTNVLFTAFVVQ